MEAFGTGQSAQVDDMMLRAALLSAHKRWAEAQLLLARIDNWPKDSVVLLAKTISADVEALFEGLHDWEKERVLLLVKAIGGELDGREFSKLAGFSKGGRPRHAKHN